MKITDRQDGVVYHGLPQLRELVKKLKLKGFVVIGLNKDIFEDVYHLQSNGKLSFRLDPTRFQVDIEP